MNVQIKIETQGKNLTFEISPNQVVKLGRSDKADQAIDDTLLSSLHCSLTLKNDHLILTDLDSKNGTFLNGVKVKRTEVFLLDRITVGQSVISIVPSVEAPEYLKFPGDQKHRMAHGLKVDFTGFMKVKEVAQSDQEALKSRIASTRAGGKPQKFKDKDDVKSKHKALAFLASLIDLALFAFVVAIPIYGVDYIDHKKVPALVNRELEFILISEFILLMIYVVVNFKMSKFSIGEKIAGIEEKFNSK